MNRRPVAVYECRRRGIRRQAFCRLATSAFGDAALTTEKASQNACRIDGVTSGFLRIPRIYARTGAIAIVIIHLARLGR
jgi:hypothetical protein